MNAIIVYVIYNFLTSSILAIMYYVFSKQSQKQKPGNFIEGSNKLLIFLSSAIMFFIFSIVYMIYFMTTYCKSEKTKTSIGTIIIMHMFALLVTKIVSVYSLGKRTEVIIEEEDNIESYKSNKNILRLIDVTYILIHVYFMYRLYMYDCKL